MSAIDRVERDNKERMMIPVNVEGLVDNEGLTTKQGVVLGILGAVLVADILWFKSTRLGESFLMWLINIGIYLSIAQLAIRKLVIDENYKMQQVSLLDKYQHCTPVLMWDIMAVNEETGVMQYSDGRVAVLLDIEQATIVGREADFNHIHFNAISDFFHELNKNNLKWVRMDLMINARNDTRLAVLGDTVNNCKIPSVQDATRVHLGYLRNMEARTLYEREFYLVIATPGQGAEKLVNVVDEAVSNLSNAAYNKIEIVKDERIAQLMAEINFVDFFDADETMRQMAKTKTALKDVFNINTIEFDNILREEQIKEGALKSDIVHRGETSTIIDVNEDVKTRIKGYTKVASKSGVEIERGAFEKFLLEKQKAKEVKQTTATKKDEAVVDLGNRQSESIFGSDDIADIKELARAEEEEAKKAMVALGREDDLKRQRITEAKLRTLNELKEKAAAEEAARKAEEEKKAAKLAEIEAEKARKKAKEVNADDFM